MRRHTKEASSRPESFTADFRDRYEASGGNQAMYGRSRGMEFEYDCAANAGWEVDREYDEEAKASCRLGQILGDQGESIVT